MALPFGRCRALNLRVVVASLSRGGMGSRRDKKSCPSKGSFLLQFALLHA